MSAIPGGRADVLATPRWGRSGDWIGGFTVALVMLALDGAYGLVGFSALGPSAAGYAFMAGLTAAIVVNLLTPIVGARGPLLAGPAAALALLSQPLIAALASDPRLQGADGLPRAAAVVALAGLGVTLAGALQLLLGAVGAGRLVRYVPYPVHAGFMNGVAVLMLLAMVPHVAGVAPLQWRGVADVRPLSVLVAVLAFAVTVFGARWLRRVPAALVALLVGTGLHHALTASAGAERTGQLLGPLYFEWPGRALVEGLDGLPVVEILGAHAGAFIGFAAATALLSMLQTLLAASVVDSVVGQRHSDEREVIGQGSANLLSGLLGGLAVAGALSRSHVGLKSGARSTAVRIAQSVMQVALLLLCTPWLPWLSMPALAGVFIAAGWSLVDDWSRTATLRLGRLLVTGARPPAALLKSYGVMLGVTAVAVFVGVGPAVLAGLLVGMVMFIAAQARDPVRQTATGAERSSRKIRHAEQADLLREHGRAIALIELEGPLFFGTADAAARAIGRQAEAAQQIIVDVARVGEIDVSGARVLLQAAAALARGGRQLYLSGLPPDAPGWRAIREVDMHGILDGVALHADIDLALEAAEDRLLERLAPAAAPPRLRLAETMLGEGLLPDELATLERLLVERRVARGETVFRRGEPGESMFVSVAGRIAIWVRGEVRDERRLVSFAPGVVFGEMSVLSGAPRSADGVAEDDVVLLELTREAFESLGRDAPQIAAKLLTRIGVHLAARLRSVTDELRAAQSRR